MKALRTLPAAVTSIAVASPAQMPANRACIQPLGVKRLLLACLLSVCLFLASPVPSQAGELAAAWPTLAHPRESRIDEVGGQIRINGTPMRIVRVQATLPVDALASHYRQVLGQPHAESQAGGAQVLAQGRGNFFITVTLQQLPDGGSEALVAVADSHGARAAAGRPLGLDIPAGTTLLSDMESTDGGIASRQFVLANAHSLRVNLDRLSATLARRGLHPESPPVTGKNGALLQHFGGTSGQAQLVLMRHENQTHAVLTLLSRQP